MSSVEMFVRRGRFLCFNEVEGFCSPVTTPAVGVNKSINLHYSEQTLVFLFYFIFRLNHHCFSFFFFFTAPLFSLALTSLMLML